MWPNFPRASARTRYQTIALQIEIFGKLAVLVLSMPVLMALLNTIKDFLS